LQHQKAKARHHTIYAKPLDLDEKFEVPHYPKGETEKKFIDQALGENFVFSHMDAEEREILIEAMQKDFAAKGSEVIKQGEHGDYFYILQEGEIEFLTDGQRVGSCSPGGSFGELALLYDAPRAATCRTTIKCVLWKVGAKTFRHVLARSAAEAHGGLCTTIKSISLFEHLSPNELSKFAAALTPVSYVEGERIITKGEIGEVFYIIQEGTVRCHDMGLGGAQYDTQLLLSKGEWFGELALMTGEPRSENVTAVSNVDCLALDRETFEACFGSLQSSLARGLKKKFIETSPVFTHSQFSEQELDDLASLCSEQCLVKGSTLAEAGKPYQQHLWIIEKGKIVVTNKHGDLFTLESGDYFGDKSVKGEPGHISSHTAIVEENCTCFVLTRTDIESVIGDINRLGESLPFTPSKVNCALTLRDLTLHRVLGSGAFGKVWLASSKADSKPYALKQLNKRQLIKANQVKAIFREKLIMHSIGHPFLLSLFASFQDEGHLYLLLEFIQGGELFHLIHDDQSNGIPNSHAVFYAACVISALGHLHQRSICYRDLKPENVMVGADGYCTVIDMGFSKVVMEKTYTLCGTPEYLAPEIITSKGHDKSVDNWAFGVLVYEMLVGKSPFFESGIDQLSLFKKIVFVKFDIPSQTDEEAKDLIQKLLQRRVAARLGNLARGNLDIRHHKWFNSIHWPSLLQKKIDAPWLPKIKNPFDVSHFDKNIQSPPYEKFSARLIDEREQLLFKDF
jgi:CRP-like cAMP-binding protein